MHASIREAHFKFGEDDAAISSRHADDEAPVKPAAASRDSTATRAEFIKSTMKHFAISRYCRCTIVNFRLLRPFSHRMIAADAIRDDD